MTGPSSTDHAWVTRVAIVVTAGGAALLVPWVLYLAVTLPEAPTSGAWRLAWVGYDVALGLSLAVSSWLIWTRRRAAVVSLAVSAVLVLSDAWFDVCLSWGTSGQTWALVSAFALELPVALLLGWEAARVLARSGRLQQRQRQDRPGPQDPT